MPALDGTGPNGKGPRTGRGLGNCPGCGAVLLKSARRGFGLGLGRGLGFGRNRNNAACCPLCPLCQQKQDIIDNKAQEVKKDEDKTENK